jgi:hypothetical protein
LPKMVFKNDIVFISYHISTQKNTTRGQSGVVFFY